MDVFMIGNGFDLHYCLPTTYTCFLRTVESISKRLAKGETITTVAQVFGDPALYKSDGAMKRCYDTYGTDYDAELDPDQISKLFGRAEQNLWFTYLLRSFDAGKGWIDFEREIGRAIRTLASALNTVEVGNNTKSIYLRLLVDDRYAAFICSHFSFFFSLAHCIRSIRHGKDCFAYPILQEYIVEEPFASKRYIVNRDAIVSKLFQELRELADMLAWYLKLFVDRPVEKLMNAGEIQRDDSLVKWPWADTEVVSFNYTSTLACLYDSADSISFVHGFLGSSDESNIVLGIDSDESDELDHLDVSFVQFKKYYQRVFFQTDTSYLNLIDIIDQNNGLLHPNPVELYVIGHSLDITDQEVIRDLFTRSTKITIFYHSNTAVADYIRNLITIFGKKQFDLLRAKKGLKFKSLASLNGLRMQISKGISQMKIGEVQEL